LNNFILGSGVVGCIARAISGYTLIPFKKSRYYSLDIPLAENNIPFTDDIEVFMSEYSKVGPIFKEVMSSDGVLSTDNVIREIYLKKVFGGYPDYAKELLCKTTMSYQMSVIQLHDKLQDKFINEINSSIKIFGDVVAIDLENKRIKFKGGQTNEFDKIISTIPLDALAKLCGVELELKAKTVCYYHIVTKTINLEGADTCLVADEEVEFFKVVKLPGENEYLFWANDGLESPYKYFGNYLTYNMDIMAAFRIQDAIPLDTADLSVFENAGISCVGCNAQWDSLVDVGTSIKRLLRLCGTNK
jgi:hypothetical protein